MLFEPVHKDHLPVKAIFHHWFPWETFTDRFNCTDKLGYYNSLKQLLCVLSNFYHKTDISYILMKDCYQIIIIISVNDTCPAVRIEWSNGV